MTTDKKPQSQGQNDDHVRQQVFNWVLEMLCIQHDTTIILWRQALKGKKPRLEPLARNGRPGRSMEKSLWGALGEEKAPLAPAIDSFFS